MTEITPEAEARFTALLELESTYYRASEKVEQARRLLREAEGDIKGLTSYGDSPLRRDWVIQAITDLTTQDLDEHAHALNGLTENLRATGHRTTQSATKEMVRRDEFTYNRAVEMEAEFQTSQEAAQ